MLASDALSQSPSRPTLYYFFDPLCGWCYGFSPVMQAVAQDFGGRLDIEVISGGMVTGSRIGPIGHVAPYIKTAYRDVENATGVRFGTGFLGGILDPGTAVFSSVEPSLALAVVKAQRPEAAVAFSHSLLHAVYEDGIAPTDVEAYRPYAAALGLDPAAFVASMRDTATAQRMETDFARSAQFGVSGFPTVVVLQGGKYYLITRGYTTYEALRQRLEQVLAK